MAVIRIRYNNDKKKNLEYKSVELSFGFTKKKPKIFDSGDFVKDWYNLKKYIINDEINEPVSYSSSVDHFIMDGAPFESAYLHVENGKCILKYLDKTESKKELSSKEFLNKLIEDKKIYEGGYEFFVHENTKPTWEELRELCGDKKKK